MKTLITTSDPAFYYTLFYKLSFLIAFLIILWEGIRRKYPLSSWLIISLYAAAFAIIGSNLSTWDLNTWQQLLQDGTIPTQNAQSTIGVFLFGILGIFVAKKVLAFKAPVLDAYAIAIPVALAVQRVGCLLAGCCFGNPTESITGFCYTQGLPVYDHHFLEGMIGPDAVNSLTVHPVPLYHIIGFITVAIILYIHRNRIKINGNLALYGFLMLFSLRFFIEFFRAPVSNHQLGDFVYGLKEIQWLLLAFIGIISFALAYRSRSNSQKQAQVPSQSFIREGFALFLVFAAIPILNELPFVNGLTVIIHKFFFVSLVFGISLSIYLYWQKQPKWVLGLLVVSLIFMAQTTDPGTETDDNRSSYWKVHMDGFKTAYTETIVTENTDCDGNTTRTTDYFDRSFKSGSAGLSYHLPFGEPYEELSISAKYFSGTYSYSNRIDIDNTFKYKGLHLAILADLDLFALGIGANLGNIYYPWEQVNPNGSVSFKTNRDIKTRQGFKNRGYAPSLHLRGGSKDKFNLTFDWYNDPAGIASGINQTFTANYGFLAKDRLQSIGIGYSTHGLIMTSEINIKNSFFLRPRLIFHDKDSQISAAIGLSYRF